MDHIMVSINLAVSSLTGRSVGLGSSVRTDDGRCDDQYPRFFPSAIVVCSKCCFIVFTIRDQ